MEPHVDAKELLQINEQAARWMLRREVGPLTRSELRRFEVWSKLPHRADALQRMEAFSERMYQPWRRRRLAMRFAARRKTDVSRGLLLPPSPDPIGT